MSLVCHLKQVTPLDRETLFTIYRASDFVTKYLILRDADLGTADYRTLYATATDQRERDAIQFYWAETFQFDSAGGMDRIVDPEDQRFLHGPYCTRLMEIPGMGNKLKPKTLCENEQYPYGTGYSYLRIFPEAELTAEETEQLRMLESMKCHPTPARHEAR